MKRKTILTLSAVAVTATVAAFAIPAIAGGPGSWGCHGMRMGGHGPMGQMGVRAMRDNPLYKSFDADSDGKLSATEFEALLAEVSKGFAARPFAMLDADGDKAISAEEMAFPVRMMAHMRAMRDAAPEDAPKP